MFEGGDEILPGQGIQDAFGDTASFAHGEALSLRDTLAKPLEYRSSCRAPRMRPCDLVDQT